jgi:pimeloyl-ACP methyl ester carboxylesterase
MFTSLLHSSVHLGLTLALAILPATLAAAQKPADKPAADSKTVKNIVLVHGAFADGSSWSKVIPLLEAKGYHVVAVQNPLTSLADDVAATKRILDLQDGPVILVGHSWGGTVITQAGDDPKVAGLVYVAAFAPDAGQSASDMGQPYGATPGQKQIKLDTKYFASLSEEGVMNDFAQGLPMAERRVVFAVQGQFYGPALEEKVTVAAWKTKPSWYIVASEDRTLSPAMEAAAAKNMKATTITLPVCHVAMLQDPKKVADAIEDAAKKSLKP